MMMGFSHGYVVMLMSVLIQAQLWYPLSGILSVLIFLKVNGFRDIDVSACREHPVLMFSGNKGVPYRSRGGWENRF